MFKKFLLSIAYLFLFASLAVAAPAPSASSSVVSTCTGAVEALNLVNRCNLPYADYYQTISYRCRGKVDFISFSKESCQSSADLYAAAKAGCERVCSTVVVPTPTTTTDPLVSLSCMPVIYKVPAGRVINPNNLASYAVDANKLPTTNIAIATGEKYIHGVRLVNNSQKLVGLDTNLYNLSVTTIIPDPSKEILQSSYYNTYCKNQKNGTTICDVEPLMLPPGQSIVLTRSLFSTSVGRLPSGISSIVGGYMFKINSSKTGLLLKDCGQEQMKLVNKTVTPPEPTIKATPTPKPSPVTTPTPYCELVCRVTKFNNNSRNICINKCISK